MTPPPDLVCEVCGHLIDGDSQRALELHLIRHGPAAVAKHIGRPHLGGTATWSRPLRGAVATMARKGASLA